jgi:hypothetical protein
MTGPTGIIPIFRKKAVTFGKKLQIFGMASIMFMFDYFKEIRFFLKMTLQIYDEALRLSLFHGGEKILGYCLQKQS